MATTKKVTKAEVPANLSVVLKTGNLPAAIAASAITYADSAKFEAVAAAGFRFSHCRYKITAAVIEAATKAQPAIYEHPANFAVAVATINPAAEDFPISAEDWSKFCLALVEDQQDAIIKASADGETQIDPSDLSALVADYFDRSRTSPRLARLTWYDDVFRKAYIARIMERNEAAKDPAANLAVMSDAALAKLLVSRREVLDLICGIDSKAEKTGRGAVRGLRQSVEACINGGQLVADEHSAWVIARCVKIESLPEDDEPV